MILTFQKRFVQPILEGTKIHTIRKDRFGRWKIGTKIHFWCGNPRNIKKHPYQFAEGIVKRIEQIEISAYWDKITIGDMIFSNLNSLNDIAINDGFTDWEEMKQFFPDYFEGKLIILEQPIIKKEAQ